MEILYLKRIQVQLKLGIEHLLEEEYLFVLIILKSEMM